MIADRESRLTSRSDSSPTTTVAVAWSIVRDVPLRPAAGQPDAAALAERDHLDRGHLAEHRAARVDDGSLRNGIRVPRNVSRPPVCVMKHTSWLSGFVGRAQTERRCPVADLRLGEVADREQRAAQFALRQHVHDVALVLGRHRRRDATKQRSPTRLDAGVVAGGDGVEAEQVGALAEAVELQVAVALDARVGREAVAVGVARTDRPRAC